MSDALPVLTLAADFRQALAAGPVVVTAPTGSGKSTVVPCWCAEQADAVLVVEPRRVACRSLARFVASRLGVTLGEEVGYAVRHDERLSARTRIAFVTPGVALRLAAAGGLDQYPVVVLDEFHERSIEVDLLLGLLAARPSPRPVVMSATLQGDRLAAFLGGRHLAATGRLFPVRVEHAAAPLLPSLQGLEERVEAAVRASLDDPGDLLVFLPGKGEIAACQSRLRLLRDLEVLPLHAGLPPGEQDRVFEPGSRRRVVLATNVAETAVTLPRIGVVIDSGLVRQTRYRGTRGYLTLVPVALDAAEQRRGRAGRLMPGVCRRLWQEAALLEPVTPPEILREGLAVALLAVAACGRTLRPAGAEALRLLDPPKPYAVQRAEEELQELGALDAQARLTPRGERLARLPVDAQLGRILLAVAEEEEELLPAAIDLVAALAPGRPLFLPGPRPEDEADDLRLGGCDATALVAAVDHGEPGRHRLAAAALEEARQLAGSLRQACGLPRTRPTTARLLTTAQRERLARAILRALPRAAYVPRRRKRETAWANGREELELGSESALREAEVEAVVVLDTHAVTVKHQKTVQRITCALPCSLATLRAAGLGEVQVGAARLEGGRLVAEAVRTYAGCVLARTEAPPEGELARQAVVRLLLQGSLFATTIAASRERLAAAELYRRLQGGPPVPELATWLGEQLARVGLESGDDLALLLPEDFLVPDLLPDQREWLDRSHPREVAVGDARYGVEYDPVDRVVTLVKTAGQRTLLPPLEYLPAWPGWRLLLRDRAVVRVLRERR